MRTGGRPDLLGLALGATLLVGVGAAGTAGWLLLRGAAVLPSGLPLGLLLAFLATLALTAAVVLWRERQLRRARAAFVAAVSHELRTSLAKIRLFTDTLREERARTDEDRERSAAIIGQEARRLGHLVETVRRFDALARADVALAPRPVALAEAVGLAAETFAPLAEANRVTLQIDVPPGLEVHADPEALAQILASLLDNAVKYGQAGGVVRVGAAAAAEGGRVWVEDAGPGVPEREHTSVWEPFRRLDRDPESHTGGGGLGLAVVRSLARLHGGGAWVEDVPGGGARFVVELPSHR